MPTYEFKCQKCGNVVERFFHIKEKPSIIEEHCSKCNETQTFETKIGTPSVMYSVFNPASKMPSEFKNRMDQIRSANPNMNSKYY